jgi:hypothetical protein
MKNQTMTANCLSFQELSSELGFGPAVSVYWQANGCLPKIAWTIERIMSAPSGSLGQGSKFSEALAVEMEKIAKTFEDWRLFYCLQSSSARKEKAAQNMLRLASTREERLTVFRYLPEGSEARQKILADLKSQADTFNARQEIYCLLPATERTAYLAELAEVAESLGDWYWLLTLADESDSLSQKAWDKVRELADANFLADNLNESRGRVRQRLLERFREIATLEDWSSLASQTAFVVGNSIFGEALNNVIALDKSGAHLVRLFECVLIFFGEPYESYRARILKALELILVTADQKTCLKFAKHETGSIKQLGLKALARFAKDPAVGPA